MEILGIGPLELLLIFVLALIILGPKDLQRTGKVVGRGLNKLVKSGTWKIVRQASEKVQSLPTELMREAGMDDFKQSLDSEIIQPVKQAQKSLGARAGEPWIPDPTPSPQSLPETPSGNPEKITPVGLDQEIIK